MPEPVAMTATRIDAATPADVSDILRLIKALADYERLTHEVVANESMIHEALFGAAPKAEALIARRDAQAVGFALYFHNFSTFLGRAGIYLEDLFVESHCRGHGIGKALLARLAALAVERGCGRFEWSVLDWNAPSIAFYESLGAKKLSEWHVYRLSGDALQALARDG
ncbi:GNAT family N-acetyltransferase [Algiphilus sp. W345]|uniref:GNAT family N-acetyltransferase n=1 Tax=Banduia mediterranea TaxID=3075609 RepID=A0ABU2WL92_9GAMM|nr:GNAT family N-acetyltransferase [Algiphilus sp. W345]MDT0498650.1 GNAT family N-acetyltransferase [Algiphilus sp. W345]